MKVEGMRSCWVPKAAGFLSQPPVAKYKRVPGLSSCSAYLSIDINVEIVYLRPTFDEELRCEVNGSCSSYCSKMCTARATSKFQLQP